MKVRLKPCAEGGVGAKLLLQRARVQTQEAFDEDWGGVLPAGGNLKLEYNSFSKLLQNLKF